MTPSTSDAPSDSAALPGFSFPRLSIALAFLAVVALITWSTLGHVSVTLVVAAVIGAYLAMNLGANDAANNIGPAVGARAITLGWAIAIAAIAEVLGAVIAGADVVVTVRSGIIDPSRISDPITFVWLMMAALLAGALWLNLATVMKAPVSTSHSIIGGILGAGIAAAGWSVADWASMGRIAMSWLISPLVGGLIAAGMLYLVKRTITFQPDLMAASRRMVPLLIAAMAWAFSTYLLLKGLNQIVRVSFPVAAAASAAIAVLTHVLLSRRIATTTGHLRNDREAVNQLFKAPLICAAALLSFAHGSNDVSNAIGPLAAIYDTLSNADIGGEAAVPTWILLLGAVGLALGLVLYGPRLVRTVGSEITELDSVRAYCIAMASATTVILASQLGLPVSTTHVAIGAVFGVGFLREYLKAHYNRIIDEIRQHHLDQDAELHVVEDFLQRFEAATFRDKDRMLKELKRQTKLGQTAISKQERKRLRKVYREDLIKRSVVMRMVAAWIVTVPASAAMAAVIFFAIRGAMLP